MINLQKRLTKFSDNDLLQQALISSMGATGEGVAIAFFYEGENYSACINEFSPYDSVQIGCIAKSLTATLIAIAESEGYLQLDNNIANYFPAYSLNEPLTKHLNKTKIYHLLNHSNGFDHSLMEAAPKTESGMIASETMLRELGNTSAILPSGEIFNYNNIGCWLAAVILENVYSKPYAEILEEYLFKPLGIKAITAGDNINICPSIGDDLRLSAKDLIKISSLHLHEDSDKPKLFKHLFALRSQFSFPTPQWLPAGELCYPGWFDFGESYGQLGYGGDSAGAIRLLPEADTAIVVTSSHQKLANTTLATVFKDIFPDFLHSPLPQLLNPNEWLKLNSSIYKGTYENAKYCLSIDTAANGSLRGKVFRKCNENGTQDTEPYIKRYFKAAADHFFLPARPEQLACPILAFSHPDKNGQFQIISTSIYIFSRIA